MQKVLLDSVKRFSTQERPIWYLSQHEHRLPRCRPYRSVRPARVLWGQLVPMHLASSVGDDACKDTVPVPARRRTQSDHGLLESADAAQPVERGA